MLDHAPMTAPAARGDVVEIRAPKGARVFEVVWELGDIARLPHLLLRGFCPCAHCQGHAGPIRWTEGTEALTTEALELTDVSEVGNYAVLLTWGDGHNTGIYAFPYLARLSAIAAAPLDTWRKLTFTK